MALDRRSFVKFAVGGVLGLHFSPLVWKLMDDSTIWTQNWNWVPVPEEGAVAYASTVNPGTGTVLKARLIQGRLKGERMIRLEDNSDNPMGEGSLPADVSALQLLYNREIRVQQPMLRDKLTGVYKSLTWDDALGVLAGKMGQLTAAGKTEAVACLAGTAGDATSEILARFMAAYDSPNLAFLPTADQTMAAAAQKVFGQSAVGFDLMNADYVVSFGTPLLEGWGAPVAARAAFVKWRADEAKLVQVDTRCSVTASQADQWIACKPGTEGLLALAMAKAIIDAGKAAVSAPALADGNFAPEKVAEITGVEADVIKAAALELAASKAGVAVCGPGPEGGPGRVQDFMAVLALNAVAGKLGKAGGVVARKEPALKALGGNISGSKKPALTTSMYDPYSLAVNALAGKPYLPEVLILAGGNPVFNGPQAQVVANLARKVPFVVAITPYMDESAAAADLILPSAHFLESWGDVATPFGSATAFYGVHKPLVAGESKAKSLGDVIIALAAKLGGKTAEALPYESLFAALKAKSAGLGDFEDLATAGFWAQDKPSYGGLGSAKIGAIKWEAPEAVAHESHHGLVMQAISSLRTTWGGDPITPYMIKILYDTTLADMNKLVVEINPETADHMHLAEGDSIELTSANGGIQAKVHLFAGAQPGMVFVPVGLGHTAFGAFVGEKGDNFNEAVEVAVDAENGLPDWQLTRVAVRKLGGH